MIIVTQTSQNAVLHLSGVIKKDFHASEERACAFLMPFPNMKTQQKDLEKKRRLIKQRKNTFTMHACHGNKNISL